MSFLQTIKDVIAWEKDADFFDKEATIKEYFKICPPEKRRKVNNYDELYFEALKYVNKQSFEENTRHMENYFYEMTRDEGILAICIGIFAYNIACIVDKNGKDWEDKIDKKAKKKFHDKKYDVNNPFDIRVGGNHRYIGHDIFTFALKNIPGDYPIYVMKDGKANFYMNISDVVGKQGDISMLDLIWTYYGKGAKSPIAGVFNCAGHLIVHFAKDLLTADGVPLPFSSLFNEYIGLDDDLILDQDDYILENKFNDWINKYNGNMKASDFATLGFIEGMCKLYTAQKKLGDKAESFNRDLKIIAMATCIMIQMSAMILNQKNILKKKDEKVIVPSGKWNVILTGAMMKAMAQEMAEVTKVRNEVNKAYSQKINEVKTNE